jgi:hypothetical protein
MSSQAYFENIAAHIKKEISNAQKSILIAVAWFTELKKTVSINYILV